MIGKGAIVGAGAVVTHDVPPFDKVAGVPAKVSWLARRPEPTRTRLSTAQRSSRVRMARDTLNSCGRGAPHRDRLRQLRGGRAAERPSTARAE